MKRHYIYLAFILLIPHLSLSQGLKFKGNEYPIDERTSYKVFKNNTPTFSSKFVIDFDISFYPPTDLGYIVRIKNESSQNIYNLFFDGRGDNLNFKFNEEGKSSLISAQINKEELTQSKWYKISILFDLVGNSIQLTIGSKTFTINDINLPDNYSPVIVFGKSDYIIDVPSFAIKNLSINNEEIFSFPLSESKGETVRNNKSKIVGEVSNPEWLINDAYYWKFKTAFNSKTIAGANYHPGKEEVYYFNRDSIYIYNVRSGIITQKSFKEKCPLNLVLGTNFIDTANNKLYAYEVHHDNPSNGISVASLDLSTFEWLPESSDELSSMLHHHAPYYDSSNRRNIIFGGFGSMHYNKNFYSFGLDTKTWEKLDFKGASITPRYFSAVGYSYTNNSLYLFGGMGNESGDQIVGRKYFYDLYKIDLKTQNISKVWEIPWEKRNEVPVREIIIPDNSYFYTLCYPEHFTNSFLKLYRFSLKDGSHTILGDSIPIFSDRITTNANLYYDAKLNSLYAIVQEFKDDISSNLKIYSILFPPITNEELMQYPSNTRLNNIKTELVIFSLLCLLIIIYALYRKCNKKPIDSKEDIHNDTDKNNLTNDINDIPKIIRPNAIYLFGEFTAIDRNGKDITHLFSVKLIQVFCIILQHSLNREGITSQHLSHLLWPDKPRDKVKNSRGVTINHLRKSLSDIDGIEVVYDKNFFRIEQTSKCYCDYTRCIEIISSQSTHQYINELIEILLRGKFLYFNDTPLLDTFKQLVEQMLEPILLEEMKKSFTSGTFNTTINLSKALFNIDSLSEEALTYQIKALSRMKNEKEAKRKYQSFISEYRTTMGSEYPNSFSDLYS